jgi:hypothetical protein
MGAESSDVGDPYRRLRAPVETPDDERCRCPDRPPVKLMQALGANPLHCMRCHGEVAPESLPLPIELADPLADWSSVHDALDRLWLDSGAYEAWAASEPLASPRRCPSCDGQMMPWADGRIAQLVCESCSLVAR